MAANLSRYFNIVVTAGASPQQEESFDKVLILGENATFDESYKVYSPAALSTFAADLDGGTSAEEYLAAQAMSYRTPTVLNFICGKMGYNQVVTVFSVGGWTAGNLVVNVNGTSITVPFHTNKNTSLDDLATAIAAHVDVNTSVHNSLTITSIANTGKSIYTLSFDLTGITGDMAVSSNTFTTKNITEMLDRLKADGAGFFCFGITSRTLADVEEASQWALTNKVGFMTASADANIINESSETSSIAYYVKHNAHKYTAVMYHSAAATSYPEFSAMCYSAIEDQGLYSLAYKTLPGFAPDNLDENQLTNLENKYCSYYTYIGSIAQFFEGKTGNASFWDKVIYENYLKSIMTSRIATLFGSVPKVPADNSGIAMQYEAVASLLKDEMERGALSQYSKDENEQQNGGYSVTMFDISTLSDYNKSIRLSKNMVAWKCWTSDAFHKVEINGILN